MEKIEEIKKQVNEYNSLVWYETSRGQVVYFLLFSTSIIIIASLFSMNIITIAVAIVSQLIIFIPLAWFIYKGKIWAIILTQFIFTFATIREFSTYMVNSNFHPSGIGIMVVFLIYLWGMKLFINAYRVEKARKLILLGR